ncbi:MAG: DUF2868 domain-containing protein, partial [Burkholderiaceae bacterium]
GLGIATDAIGSSHSVNILAPPLMLLMLWNIAVYAFIGLKAIWGWFSGASSGTSSKTDSDTHVAKRIALARGTTVMHCGAAAMAAGALASMYWRGLVFDYQALWQSTFLSVAAVHQIISVVLGPASWISGLALPDVTALAQLRYPGSVGENAGRWMHWYAITVFLVVLLPRGLLALWSHRQAQGFIKPVLARSKSKTRLETAAASTQTVPPSLQAERHVNKHVTIALSLISHTNVGKTTLARTLLGRDIGEVRDAEHVTHTAERHILVQALQGDTLERLELWDTPGFGDSERLAKRLAQGNNALGWFMSEVWDRIQNRDFWFSQRAVRNILDEADVVLYLINASEAPEDMAYLDAELKVLDLIGKPVIVLLNQLGSPSTPAEAAAELQQWQRRMGQTHGVKDVLLLDAFTRCWVQEGRLLQAITSVLPRHQTEFARLSSAWQTRNRQRWHAAMDVLAQRLARAAQDRELLTDAGWTDKLKEAGTVLGKAMGLPGGAHAPKEFAMTRLAQRLDTDIRTSMDTLIALHHLDGRAGSAVLTRLAEHYALQTPQSEGKAALWGGVVTGALMGLKADILSGGLTLGGGMLAGGVLGALGGAGLARGYNLVKGVDQPTVAWTPDVLDGLTRSALLGYLTVAHFGRGRGAWTDTEPPAFWVARIDAALAPHLNDLHALWATAAQRSVHQIQTDLKVLLVQTSQTLLRSLYPDTPIDHL